MMDSYLGRAMFWSNSTGRYFSSGDYCSMRLFESKLSTLEPKPKNLPHGPRPKAKKGKLCKW